MTTATSDDPTGNRIEVRLLDHFSVRDAGGEIPLTSRKAIALLVYLSMQRDRSSRRDAIANLLWENVETIQGRVNLRQAISALRRLEGPGRTILHSNLESLRLSDDLWFDTDEFVRLSDSDPLAAAELYHADPMAGFVLRSAPAFNEWLSVMQAHWRQRAVQLMIGLLDTLEAAEDWAAIPAIGARLLSLDPYNEAAHRALMRVYARQGRSALAVSQYRTLSDLLRREMGVAPEAETQALHAELQAFRRHRDNDAGIEMPATPAPVVPVPSSSAPPRAVATPRIAVVDDEAGVRDAVGTYLRLNGFDVVECSDGADLDRALAVQDFDLFILDVTMPGEDGFSIARRLNRGAGVPTIMLTSRTDLVDRVVGLELGADDYVGKPFELRELLARVRAVLRRSYGEAGA